MMGSTLGGKVHHDAIGVDPSGQRPQGTTAVQGTRRGPIRPRQDGKGRSGHLYESLTVGMIWIAVVTVKGGRIKRPRGRPNAGAEKES